MAFLALEFYLQYSEKNWNLLKKKVLNAKSLFWKQIALGYEKRESTKSWNFFEKFWKSLLNGLNYVRQKTALKAFLYGFFMLAFCGVLNLRLIACKILQSQNIIQWPF